jgi:transcriptional regulator
MSSRFSPRDDSQVTQLITHYPLAWIVSPDEPTNATPLPLRPEQVDHDRIVTLIGHYARVNPQVAHLQKSPRATLLFMGPNGYVSPSWFTDRTQAPTWNYASISCDARIEFLDNHDDLDRIVRDLVEAMEGSLPNRWRIEEMHERYDLLLRRIIPFRAHVLATKAKFKLGQDERDDVYPEIIRGLAAGANGPLIEMMNEANPGRAVPVRA